MASIDRRHSASWVIAIVVVLFAAMPSSAAAAPEDKPTLVPLYVSFATLQALDLVSTNQVLKSGGSEANPLVAGAWHVPGSVVAMKAATTAGLIIATEHLRKQNPKVALIVMVAANSAMAMIVAHNFAIAGR